MILSFKVTTIAGTGQYGFKDGSALNATVSCRGGMCISKDDELYFSDYHHIRIRMIYKNNITTIAGNGQKGFKDGNALEAMFDRPMGICCSNDGILYVNDSKNNRIRMIHCGQVTTVAGNGQAGFRDGNALEAMFWDPWGICISNDNTLFVTDYNNHRIRMIHCGQVTTIAGNGQPGFKDGNAPEAMFNNPMDICCSKDGRLYLNNYSNHRIRMIYNNQVTTIAGNGQRGFKDGNTQEAIFSHPHGISISRNGTIYVSDSNNLRIRMICGGKVITIAGNGEAGLKDGNALEAKFCRPYAICISNDGRLYVSDCGNNRIRMISAKMLPKSPLGFELLLDMRENILSDCQISFNDITYHLHSVLINVRCPLLLDQSYFTLIQQSNISNESFDSFVRFLYSNKFTKENNQTWPTTMSIKNIVEMIFLFDILMNCKWILAELKTRFTKQLFEMLEINQQEHLRELVVELLPHVYNLKEIVKNKPSLRKTRTRTNISCIEYCYNLLIDQLENKQAMIAQHLPQMQSKFTTMEDFVNVMQQLISNTTDMEPRYDQSMMVYGAELTELCKLAFYKTNISQIENDIEVLPVLELQSPVTHLNEWTNPDFVIKLCNNNDDDNNILYHVHKLILCGRWKYFRLMIESGLKEANDNEMTLSDDWTKSRFEKMMKYIYLNEIEFDELDDIEWLMENQSLYGILDYQ